MPEPLTEQAISEKLSQELRRGSVVLAALSQLATPRYGYALLERLGDRGFAIEQGTLYPLLRRLDEQGLLTSEWQVEGSRPRKYYRLSRTGSRLLSDLTSEWRELVATVEGLLTTEQGDD